MSSSTNSRVVQLERELAEKDKKLLVAREECAVAQEEAQQKTKLAIQLQKQLVEFEKQLKFTGGSTSSTTKSGSLMGALMGVASGESLEITRLKTEIEVQREELLSKIHQNESLRIQLDETLQATEREKRQFSLVLDAEVKRATKFEKGLSKKTEELDVLRTQHEILLRELNDKDVRLFQQTEELASLRRQNRMLNRKVEREDARRSLIGSREGTLTEVELVLLVQDIAFWLEALDHPQPLERASKTLIDVLREGFTLRTIQDSSALGLFLDKVYKSSKMLSSSSTPLFSQFVKAFESSKEPTVLLEALSVEAAPDEIKSCLKSIIELSHKRASSVSSGRPPAMQSDESLLESIEDAIEPKPSDAFLSASAHLGRSNSSKNTDRFQKASEVMRQEEEKGVVHSSFVGSDETKDYEKKPDPMIKSTVQDQSTTIHEAITLDVPSEATKQSKMQYHVQSLNYLRQIRILETELSKAKTTLDSSGIEMARLVKERDAAVLVMDELKTQVRKSKEDLEETRRSYDLQLVQLSDRIVELERLVRAREEEIRQAKGEGLLLQQIKKSFQRS